MPQFCAECKRSHRFRKYNGLCKECHVIRLERERIDKVCIDCGDGFLVKGTEAWKNKCFRCYFLKSEQSVLKECLLNS